MKIRIQMLGIFLFAFLALAGCGSRKPRLPGREKKFVLVYAELAKMRERIPVSNPAYEDSARVLLKKFGYTPADFRKSLDYFNETPERWAAFYLEVRKILRPSKSSAAAPR